jgi:hypothetical protein
MAKRAKKPQHGGARKGAGRPSSGRRPYMIRLKPEIMEGIKTVASEKSAPVGEVIEDAFLKTLLTIKKDEP